MHVRPAWRPCCYSVRCCKTFLPETGRHVIRAALCAARRICIKVQEFQRRRRRRCRAKNTIFRGRRCIIIGKPACHCAVKADTCCCTAGRWRVARFVRAPGNLRRPRHMKEALVDEEKGLKKQPPRAGRCSSSWYFGCGTVRCRGKSTPPALFAYLWTLPGRDGCSWSAQEKCLGFVSTPSGHLLPERFRNPPIKRCLFPVFLLPCAGRRSGTRTREARFDYRRRCSIQSSGEKDGYALFQQLAR